MLEPRMVKCLHRIYSTGNRRFFKQTQFVLMQTKETPVYLWPFACEIVHHDLYLAENFVQNQLAGAKGYIYTYFRQILQFTSVEFVLQNLEL